MKRIDLAIEPSPEVSKLMKGFMPRIGNSEDIKIVEMYSKLLNLLTLVSDQEKRAKDKGKTFILARAKQVEISEVEERLINLMNKKTNGTK